MSTRHKPGEETGISRDTPTRIRGLTVFGECLAVGLACEISADLGEAVAH